MSAQPWSDFNMFLRPPATPKIVILQRTSFKNWLFKHHNFKTLPRAVLAPPRHLLGHVDLCKRAQADIRGTSMTLEFCLLGHFCHQEQPIRRSKPLQKLQGPYFGVILDQFLTNFASNYTKFGMRLRCFEVTLKYFRFRSSHSLVQTCCCIFRTRSCFDYMHFEVTAWLVPHHLLFLESV